jgi:uncharacterized tellurite resistance protein B-like protein
MPKASPYSPSRLFSFVRHLVDRVQPVDGAADDVAREERLALATLLVHIARIDGIIVPAEWQRLEALFQDEFGLTAEDAEALAAEGEMADRGNADIEALIAPLRRRLDIPARRHLLQLAWDIAKADGAIRELEDDLLWRAATLLGLDEAVAADVRRQATSAEASEATGGM